MKEPRLAFETHVVSGNPREHACDLLALLVREGAVGVAKISDAQLAAVDGALGGLLHRVARDEEFTGKENTAIVLHTHGKIGAHKLLVAGLGKKKDEGRDLDLLRAQAARAVRAGRSAGAKSVAVSWPHADGDALLMHELQALAEGAQLGAYKFDRYLREKKPPKLRRLDLLLLEKKPAAAHRDAAALGVRIGEATCAARDLVNEPAGQLTPGALAETARTAARDAGLHVEVLGRAQIEKLDMRLFLAVAQGSTEEPRLVKMSWLPPGHRPAAKGAKSGAVALVGKAITFDSGGLSLKTAAGMEEMKTDMAGAAAVLQAMRIVASLKPPFPVHGYFGACENMPSGTAYRPGDIVVGKNGVSVEVLNTDAEGRLVLADVLTWACEEKPALVVDLATLTGACVVALGPLIGGLFCNDEPLATAVLAAARRSGEEIWRLPLPAVNEEFIRSPIADLKNTGGRWGGAINAALFLQHFVGKTPWAHLDIAGPSAADRERSYNPRGATGAGVRLLAELIRQRASGRE